MSTKLIAMLSLTFSLAAFGSAYSQYRLIKEEVINNQTICTYENAQKTVLVRTHKPKKKCPTHINTNREK